MGLRKRSVNLALFLILVLFVGGGLLFQRRAGKAPGENGSPFQNKQNNQKNPGTQEGQDGTAAPFPRVETPNAGYGETAETDESGKTGEPAADGNGAAIKATPPAIDLEAVKPDESGRIIIVMFHNFIGKYEKGDVEYTTTFDAFRELLDTLYNSGYRPVGLNSYLEGKIDTPAGFVPIIFTFDDGSEGQFSLVESDGGFKANPSSAVGIMEEFSKEHPDFGPEGTFFVNLGNRTFGNTGTLGQRLGYLINKGFEIGNHTYSHINLKNEGKTAEIIQKELGLNQAAMYRLAPGYKFNSFSLPYGAPSGNLMRYVIKGEYEGVRYENKAILKVGAEPAPSPYDAGFDPFSLSRVRATGIKPVKYDLAWWLANYKHENLFISDGDPASVTVPARHADRLDMNRLGGRKLVIY